MRIPRKLVASIIPAALLMCLLPNMVFVKAENEFEVGNTDINIQNGGTMLSNGDDFYFVEDGIFAQQGESVTPICADDAKNLNFYDGNIYYTLGCEVYIIPKNGGETSIVFTADREIKQMYVVNGDLIYLAGGEVFILKNTEEPAEKTSNLSDVTGIIPTQYGNILLTGKPLNRTLWVNDTEILSGITLCYTDSGYLAVSKDEKNYMANLNDLFDDFDEQTELLDYNIHGKITFDDILDESSRTELDEDIDNTELMCNFDEMLSQAGMNTENVSLMEVGDVPNPAEPVIPKISQGQRNIVLRARQLHEVEWTPLADRYQWGYRGVFKAGETYRGLPYSQAVNTNGYVGYGVSFEKFATDMCDNTSKFYTTYSKYNKIAPAYGTDCSGFVSYAWGLEIRRTTYTIPGYAEKVGNQSIYSLQVGDALDKRTNHIVLVSDVTYDAEGQVNGVEIMEQTPVITRLTRYGEGQSRSLYSLQSYYLERGYDIYRNPNRDTVKYEASPYVPLNEENGIKEKAPFPTVVGYYGGKTVTLKSENPNSRIFYTLDGSVPTQNSKQYADPLNIINNSMLKAISVSENCGESLVLNYSITIPQADTPKCVLDSGLFSGNYVSAGSTLSISPSDGTEIHYTTDGSEPTKNSPIFSQPIKVNRDITIKAFALANGKTQSKTAIINLKIGNVYTITATAGNNGSVSPNGTMQVIQTGAKTIKITPSSGYKVKEVLVDGNSVGAVQEYTFSNINSNHTISVSFEIKAQIPFSDVGKGEWFYDAVCYSYANNLFIGTSDTKFSPHKTMNRGMFITVLGRVAGVSNNLNSGIGVVTGEGVNIRSGPSTQTEIAGFVSKRYTAVQVIGKSENWYKIQYGTATGYIRNDLITVYNGGFSDLASNQYYSQFVEWAYLMGITSGTSGTSSGNFNANTGISREDMCLMMYNYAIKYGKQLPNKNTDGLFSDDASISAGAKPAVYALRRAGVINGMGNNMFNPQDTASRAQVSEIFMNFLKAVK